MATDPDVIRAARHMIENHGRHALFVAERRALNLAADGSRTGAEIWTQIARAVRQLQRPPPAPLA